MTFAASASPTSCEPGSRSRLLPDKATISVPFFRCCVDAGAFSDSFIGRRGAVLAVFCGAAIYNLLSFLVPYCGSFLRGSLRLIFVCVKTKLIVENIPSHDAVRASPRFCDD